MGVAAFFWGSLSDKFGTRIVVLSGSVLLGLGLVTASRAQSLWQFQLLFGGLIGIAAGSFYAPMMAVASAWIIKHRSLAVALVSAGMGVAPVTVAPSASWLITTYDWRTAMLVIGIVGPTVAGPYEDGKAAFDRGDFQTALRDWRPLAHKGVAEAEFGLGVMYANGDGVAPDYGIAASWFRKAAEKNYAAAQFELGGLYVNGHGVAKDYAIALGWFRKAADQGYADGQFALGVMYENGQGVVQDYATAASWYRSAANLGNATAQYALGILYYKGEGVPKDLAAAFMWFDLAAARGDKLQPPVSTQNAIDYRDIVATKMSKEQIAEAEKRAREWKPK